MANEVCGVVVCCVIVVCNFVLVMMLVDCDFEKVVVMCVYEDMDKLMLWLY